MADEPVISVARNPANTAESRESRMLGETCTTTNLAKPISSCQRVDVMIET